jgi:hypothetical protein
MPMLHELASASGWKVQWECHESAHPTITHTVGSARQRRACFHMSQTGSCIQCFHGGQLTDSACKLAWGGKQARMHGAAQRRLLAPCTATTHADAQGPSTCLSLATSRTGATLCTCGTRRPRHCRASHPPAAHGPAPPPKSSQTDHTVLSRASPCCSDAPSHRSAVADSAASASPAGACGAGRACACMRDASSCRRGPAPQRGGAGAAGKPLARACRSMEYAPSASSTPLICSRALTSLGGSADLRLAGRPRRWP